MTCRNADRLMEHVLDGEAEEEAVRELQEHVRRCERCARLWQTAWQVRSLMKECDAPDPGEEYFERVTEGIIARIGAASTQPAKEAPVVGSMRYGPLAMRGGAMGFLFALGLLLSSLAAPRDEAGIPAPHGGLPNLRLAPACAVEGGPAMAPGYVAMDHHPGNQRQSLGAGRVPSVKPRAPSSTALPECRALPPSGIPVHTS